MLCNHSCLSIKRRPGRLTPEKRETGRQCLERTSSGQRSCLRDHKLKNIPIVDEDLRPLGVLHARDILQVLLEESEDEESILRDYVMGIGY